nr:uncharacterized protein LOC131782362 [Pocillopora verrucosa]
MTSRPGSMRNLGIVHIVFGILLTIFGIAEFQVTSKTNVFLRYFLSKGETYYFGVWIGIWMLVTGIVGVFASRKDHKICIGTFIFLSIVSSLFGVMIIVAYGTYLSLIWIVAILFPLPVAIAGAIAVLGLIEFIVGLWAAIHSCLTFVDGTPFVGEAVRGQQLQFNDNPAVDKAKGSEGVFVSIPFKEELERTTDVGTFSPGVQEQRPQTFPLRIIGNTQVHPETVDPIHG